MLVAGQASAGVSCHKINAREVGRDLGGGNFASDVKGGGLLHGTSAASLALSGGPAVFAVNGPLTFTTNKGTLTVDLSGTFVVSGSTGTYASSGPVVAATGKLAGATGSLTVVGAENLVGEARDVWSASTPPVPCADRCGTRGSGDRQRVSAGRAWSRG